MHVTAPTTAESCTHKTQHTCLLLPICCLCRAHVAKTEVRMWLGVSSTCHAGTNKQHSIACECDTLLPLSHQHKQATTSLQLLARGWWCGCVKHASPSPSPPAHTPTHLMTQRWRSVGEERRGRRSKWDGRGSHQQRQWVQSQSHGISAALLCLHMKSETARRGREGVGVSTRCVQITRCAWCAWCAPTIPITLSLSQLHANGM